MANAYEIARVLPIVSILVLEHLPQDRIQVPASGTRGLATDRQAGVGSLATDPVDGGAGRETGAAAPASGTITRIDPAMVFAR